MNQKSLPIILVAIVSISIGCGDSEQQGDALLSDSQSGPEIVSVDLSEQPRECAIDSQPALSIGKVDGEQPYLLFRAFGATRLSDGRIVISNQGSHELRYFSPDGEFLYSAGSEGEGPGEFSRAFVVWRQPGDTLWVADYRPWGYEVFDADGNWVRHVSPEPLYLNPPEDSKLLADGKILIAETPIGRSQAFEQQRLDIMLHEASGVLIDTVLSIPHRTMGRVSDGPSNSSLSRWFDARGHIAAKDNLLAIAHGDETKVDLYEVTDTLKHLRSLRLEGQDLEIHHDMLKAAEQELRDRYRQMPSEVAEPYLAALLSDERPMAERLPSLADLRFSDDGAIWIKLYPRPGPDMPQGWVRLTSKGAYSCHLELPSSFEVFEIGSDYILGKRDDPGKTEVVDMYSYASP